MFSYTLDNKRYHTLNYFYQNKFHSKVFKISLNASFTCPNRDGTKGIGGCIFCSSLGSGDFAGDKSDDLVTQFNKIKKQYKKKWPNGKYIGYFQANTNTYAEVSVLKEKYEQILALDNVIGLSIATRPDAISDDCLDYLEELAKRTYLTVELGLQTIHEETSKFINRCHTLECFDEMVKKLRARNINVVVHIINGLPYETKEMMLETVKHINKLDIQGVKIHMLHILKDTKLAKIYEDESFKVLTKEEYVSIVCDQLELLREEIVIHRITGDPDAENIIEPKWLLKKFCVLNEIDKELARRHTYQGFNRSILNRVHQIMDTVLRSKDLVVDATVGNGNDTLYLSNIVNEGLVFGFDIQKEALDNTKELLKKHNKNNVKLILQSHDTMLDTLQEYRNKISLITFNLGYLPNGDKAITTKNETTIMALQQSLKLLNQKGMLMITIYPGHKEGQEEDAAIKKWLKSLNDYEIEIYHNTDNLTAPYLITISKIPSTWR